MSQKSVAPQLAKNPSSPQLGPRPDGPDHLPESNSAETARLGLEAPTASTPTAMEILGDIGLSMLPLGVLIDVVRAHPEAAPHLARHSAHAIAELDPELAWSLVDQALAPGTGVGVTGEVLASLEGVPLAASTKADLRREDGGAFELDVRRQGALQVGPEGATAAFEVEHRVAATVSLQPGDVLDLLGLGTLVAGAAVAPQALGALARHIDEQAPNPIESLEARVVAQADETIGVDAPFAFGTTLAPHLDDLIPSLEAGAQLGGTATVHAGTDGAWHELELDGSAQVDLRLPGLEQLRGLPGALASWGVGARATVRVGTSQTDEGLVYVPGEVRVEWSTRACGDQTERTELVFANPLEATEALTGEPQVQDAGEALATSGLVSLSRSVELELTRGQEDEVAPGLFSTLADVLPREAELSDRELAIHASAKVTVTEALIEALRGVPLPEAMEASDGARLCLERLLDWRRGQDPGWLDGHLDREQLLSLAPLTERRLVGQIRYRFATGTEALAGAQGEVRRTLDTRYDGELLES